MSTEGMSGRPGTVPIETMGVLRASKCATMGSSRIGSTRITPSKPAALLAWAVGCGGIRHRARSRLSADMAAEAAISIRKPSRDGPAATANGIEDASAMVPVRPLRSARAMLLG